MCFTHEILNISDSFPILTTKIFIQAVAACSRILVFTSKDVLSTFPILTTCVCSFLREECVSLSNDLYLQGVSAILRTSVSWCFYLIYLQYTNIEISTHTLSLVTHFKSFLHIQRQWIVRDVFDTSPAYAFALRLMTP